MNRKDFLTSIGFGALGIAVATIASCTSNNGVSAPSNVDFNLDLSLSAYSALNSVGGSVTNQGVIVARIDANTFSAVSVQCTHEGVSVTYNSNSKDFYCPRHGSVFSSTGNVINGPASSALQKYNTSLSGTKLRVYS